MRLFVLAAMTFAALATAGVLFEHSSRAAPVLDSSEFLQSNEQFAVKFCYSQYKDQSDVARCLAHNLP